jgi:hypothetical protein
MLFFTKISIDHHKISLSEYTHHVQSVLTVWKSAGRLSTVDFLIKVARFVIKVYNIFTMTRI